MKKQGQAVMEFLMVYGWAILVVLAAIAALAYFGILSPDRFLPEKCTMPSGVACLDFSMNKKDGVVTISIQNRAGFDMENVSVTLPGELEDPDCGVSRGNQEDAKGDLLNGWKELYAFKCNNLPEVGERFKTPIVFEYTNAANSRDYVKTGELIVTVQ